MPILAEHPDSDSTRENQTLSHPGTIVILEDGSFGVLMFPLWATVSATAWKIVIPDDIGEPHFKTTAAFDVVDGIGGQVAFLDDYATIVRCMHRAETAHSEVALGKALTKQLRTRKDGVRQLYSVGTEQTKKPANRKKEVRVSEGKAWYNHLLPGSAEGMLPGSEESRQVYETMQQGNVDKLASHLYHSFFFRNPQTHEVLLQKLARSMPNPHIEAYETEDAVQEVIFKILKYQQVGRLSNIPYEKFPAYIATMFKNLGTDMQREKATQERRYGHQTQKTLHDLADMIADRRNLPGQRLENQELLATIRADFQEINDKVIAGIRNSRTKTRTAQNERIWLEYVMKNKQPEDIARELNISSNTVSQVIKRIGPQVTQMMREKGYKDRTYKDFRQASLNLFDPDVKVAAAVLSLQEDGSITLRKAAPIIKAERGHLVKKTITNKAGKKQTVLVNPTQEESSDEGHQAHPGENQEKPQPNAEEGKGKNKDEEKNKSIAKQQGKATKGAIKSALKGFIQSLVDTLKGSHDVHSGTTGGAKEAGAQIKHHGELEKEKVTPKTEHNA